jgi:shikimate kinase
MPGMTNTQAVWQVVAMRADKQLAPDALKRALSNVLWVGGSVCAGKSSVATLLAERHGLRVYHFDRQEPFHIYRSVPEHQPHLIAFMAMTMDERWVLRSPDEMARQAIAQWSEDRFPMVVDDLLGLPGTGAIIAEGAGLFPAQVEPLLSDRRAAIWLIASAESIRQVRSVRGEGGGVANLTSDPPRAFENLVARDVLMAQYTRREAELRGLTIVAVDAQNVADIADKVEQHFALLLESRVSAPE